jgi:molecular chaperone GrpE (heat shock protein)
MTAEEAAEWGKTLSFEKVWAALMETDRKFAEAVAQMKRSSEETDERLRRSREETDEQMRRSREETDEQMRRSREETDRILAETAAEIRRMNAETDKEIKDLSKNVGGINNSLGKWMEQMTAAQLWKKFDQFDFVFTKDSLNVKFRDKTGRIIAEVDIFLENGDYVMLVEVKLELTLEDVDKHLERIEKVRRCMDERGDKRTIVASVAGSIVSQKVCEYAQGKGLYVLLPSGDSVAVANVPEGFTRKEW